MVYNTSQFQMYQHENSAESILTTEDRSFDERLANDNDAKSFNERNSSEHTSKDKMEYGEVNSESSTR